jgi:hypothetical protein
MKRRTTLIVAVVVAIVVTSVVTWWLAPRARPPVARATEPEDLPTPVESATPATATPIRDEGKRLQQQERAKSIVQAIERTNVPINFWGKVVDQNQQSIDSVSVQYSYSTEHGNIAGAAWSEQKIHKTEVTTNVAGMFVVSGVKGHTLTVESLMKEGYTYTSRSAKVYNYYGDTASGKFTPEPANPVVFVMVSKSIAERLVSYGGSFGRTIRLPGNGAPVRWSLWKGQPDTSGELEITFKREPAVLARVGGPATWSAKVAIIGGGIVEAPPDEPFYRAPAEGYVSELGYPKVEQKRGVPARSFYIKTAGGKYGRIELDLYADDEGPTARCLIKASMNPSGSQNLEEAAAATSR